MPEKFVTAPLIYIIIWCYLLFSLVIPTLSVHLSDFLTLTLWEIIGTILFFFPFTIQILVIAGISFVLLLLD